MLAEGLVAMWRRFFFACLLSCVTEVNAVLGRKNAIILNLAFVRLIILPVTIVPNPAGYNVVVMSLPQSPVPFSVQTVHLNCSITPVPPGIVEYRWTPVPLPFSHYGFPKFNVSLPYTTLRFNYSNVHYTSYYCHVYSNRVQVASGKITVSIQGQHRSFLHKIMVVVVT